MSAVDDLLAAFADEDCPLAGALADYRAASLRAARLEYLRETDARPGTEAVCERAAAEEKHAKEKAVEAAAEFYGIEVSSTPARLAGQPLAPDWESSIGVTDWSKGRAA